MENVNEVAYKHFSNRRLRQAANDLEYLAIANISAAAIAHYWSEFKSATFDLRYNVAMQRTVNQIEKIVVKDYPAADDPKVRELLQLKCTTMLCLVRFQMITRYTWWTRLEQGKKDKNQALVSKAWRKYRATFNYK